ncbi:MAG: hypothetical protein ACI4VK_01105 [Candidatus Coproplasma sp.]
MAEERLIDTDKDKKYRIRKNADGEDELYIDESSDEEETEEVTFMVEDEADNTAEDPADRYSQTEDERAQTEQEVAELIQLARKECEEGRFATAADYLEKAMELDSENGEIYALELIIYTGDFTDYSRIKDAASYADEIEKYTSAETKAELFARAKAGLEENITSLQKTVDELSEENERQKAVRGKKFTADRNRSAVLLSIALAIFAALAVGSVICYLNIHTVQTNTYLIVAIVLTVVGVAALSVSCVFLRNLLTDWRRVRLNNKNTATELGRNMLAHKADLDAFTAIYEALKG